MMNVYNGNVVTDKHGTASVVLPEYFEALNRDFRYQLTVIGEFAQAIVAKKVDTIVCDSDEQAERGSFLAGDRHPAGRLR
jgi:hypothetical protein